MSYMVHWSMRPACTGGLNIVHGGQKIWKDFEAVGWGPAALALEDPENATEHKNQASTMTPVSGAIFSISIALGVHLTTFYTNLSRMFATWQD